MQSAKTPLDVILSISLLIVLGWFGIKWASGKDGARKLLGWLLLSLLTLDVLQTSPYWLGIFNSGVKLQSTAFTRLEALKNA